MKYQVLSVTDEGNLRIGSLTGRNEITVPANEINQLLSEVREIREKILRRKISNIEKSKTWEKERIHSSTASIERHNAEIAELERMLAEEEEE